MTKQNHSFVYYLAWLVIGVFFGLLILLIRGDIRLDINQQNQPTNNNKSATQPAQFTHTGFADAVMKAAPAVVSIQNHQLVRNQQ